MKVGLSLTIPGFDAPSARHRDERTRKADGGPCSCNIIKQMTMGHGLNQHDASLHNTVDLEVKESCSRLAVVPRGPVYAK